MNEKLLKIQEVFSDQAFVREMLDADSIETVQQMLSARGIDMSLSEIELMGELLEEYQNGTLTGESLTKLINGCELTEDELDNVAGGTPPVVEAFVDLIDDAGKFTKAGENVIRRYGSIAGTAGSGTPWGAVIVGTVVAVGVIAAGVGYVTRRW